LVPYKNSRDSLANVTLAFSRIVKLGLVFLNQNDELLFEM